MKRILMVGGAGWVGHNTSNRLAELGYDVTVLHLSMDEKFVPFLNENIRHILGDAKDERTLDEVLNCVEPDIVVDIHPSPSETPKRCKLFAGKVEHFLQCSSAGVYVPTGRKTVAEDAKIQKHPEFGDAFINKAITDEIAMDYHRQGKLDVTIVRPAIILGKGFTPLELWGYRNPAFFEAVRNGGEIIVSKQTDVLMSVVHVKQVAEIFAQAIRQPAASKGEIFNAVTVSSFTHAEYLQAICKVYNTKPVVKYLDTEELIKLKTGQSMFYEGDYRFFMADLGVNGQKASELLGVKPQMTLDALLRESLGIV